MKNKLMILFCCAVALGATVRAQTPSADPGQDAFATLLVKGQKSPDAMTAEEMMKLLQLGQELGRPVTVTPVVRSYLAKHADVPLGLLKLAAENASASGDYRVAVARYKQMLKTAAPGPETSQAATDLYRILVDYIIQPDVAFQFMLENGDRIRAPGAATIYDQWFLDRCYEQRQLGAMTKRLVSILTQASPVDQERMIYPYVDRFLDRLLSSGAGNADAIVPGRQLPALIRGSPIRAARAKFLIENLAYRSGAAGKDQAAVEKDFDGVLAAAQAYVEVAPKDATVRDIFTAFLGGVEAPSEVVWAMQLARKQAFFERVAFEKLSDSERATLLTWNVSGGLSRLATPSQWAALGGRHVELFKKSPARTMIPLVTLSANPAVYKTQAQFLEGACSAEAAIINSLAASTDFGGAVRYLVVNESWYGSGDNYADIVGNRLLPAYNLMPRATTNALPANAGLDVIVAFARDHYFKSPLAVFSQDGAGLALVWMWKWGGPTPDDKSKFVEQLHLLDWVPYSPEERRKVFERVRAEVRSWTDETRRLHEASRRGNNPAVISALAPRVALVGPIEAALRQAAELETGDPAKAPNATCRSLAQAMVAVRQKNRDAYVQAGRSLYQAIRDYEVKKTPYGEALLGYLTVNRLDRFDTFDFQCDILADQIGVLTSQGGRRGLSLILRNLPVGRTGWRYGLGSITPSAQDQAMRVKLNGIFAKAVESGLASGKFDAELFNMYRGVRLSEPRDMDLISKLIDQRVFQKNPEYRVYSTSATCSYMALIRNEFPTLAEKYPVERWFDDMFIEEFSKAGGVVDAAYWSYGRDEQRKVVNAVAAHLGQFARLPFGYDDQPARYSAAQYWELFTRALGAEDSVRTVMLAKMDAAYGTNRFDEVSAGRSALTLMPVRSIEERQAFFDRLTLYADRSARAPSPFTLPYLPQVVTLEKAGPSSVALTDTEGDVLARCFAKCWWMPASGVDNVIGRYISVMNDSLLAKGRTKDLIPMIPMFWRIARDAAVPAFAEKLTGCSAEAMGNGLADLAGVYSSAGLEIMGGRIKEESRTALKALKSKALSTLGGSLMVDRSDRRYPIFAAQASYMEGKLDTAWEQYLSGKEVALSEFKELDIEFSIWLVERHIELGEYEQADTLAQRLIQWVDSTPQGFDMEVRARLLMVYAGIAFARQEYPRARSQYERITVAHEFENTQGALLAEIKIADIDRIAKRYDSAIERLEKLRRRSDRMLQAESNYQLALIKFELDDVAAARDYVNQVFALNMNHANARILEGKINLKMKKLIEATDVPVGMATDRMTIIPGKPLKVQIDDPNLNVVGRMANIEVRVWTASGDDEFFRLLPFGDSKTKFQGEMQTALAPLVKGDHILQVLGRDKVNYCFSDQFKRAAGITNDTVTTIDVISDAELSISSGKILSREEQEELELQRQLLVIDKTSEAEGKTLSSVRANNEIKPGNPVSVRVMDPDRSITAGKDQIKVRVVTSSGDLVEGAVLTETETHSGVFEGKVQTASAAATAFASDSEEGNEPAFAISGSNYPPWVALADNRRPKSFTVDLNNNLMLGRLNILADVPGRRLKRLSVQTSMNGKDFTTLATWPEVMPDWDGYLRCRLVKYSGQAGRLVTLSAFNQYLGSDYMVDGNEMVYLPGMLSGKIGTDMLGQNARLNLAPSGEGSRYVAHFQGVFYASERRSRTFRVDTKGKRTDVSYILTLDGKTGDRGKPLEVTMLLEKGLHQFDLYIAAERRSEPEFELQCDIPEEPFMARCPTAMFMTINRPKNAPAFVSQIAKIVTDSASNAFSVVFATNTAARLIRIGLADFEGDAPSIRRLSLVSAGGIKVLPTKDDILMLRRNQTLEIVPGDRISVIYEDPSFVTKEKKVLEAFMNVTFYNAKINAAFVDSGVDERGRRQARYIPMRRFRAGDAISVLITDSDGDVSDAQDKLKFTARLARGKAIELEALESSAHSGVFIGRFFPVSGEPQRPSELKIEDGDDVVLSYVDEQNTDYGIPWYRTYQVEQTVSTKPELRIFNYTSRFLDAEELKANVDKPDVASGETMPIIRSLTASRPVTVDSSCIATNFIGCPLIAELEYPTIALSPLSTCILYVQTSSALKQAGRDQTNAFDETLPGTLKYEFPTGEAGAIDPPPGYQAVMVRGNTNGLEALDDGRFTFVIPMQLGEGGGSAEAGNLDKNEQTGVISASYVNEEGRTAYLSRKVPRPILTIRPDDEITVAYELPGETNQATRWLTRGVVLSANAFFDVMDQRYQEPLRTLYVGERVYLRIVDPLRDVSSKKDAITVKIPVLGGSVTQSLSLVETFAHSGTFKGSFLATYSGTTSNALPPDVVPVNYGETVNMSYQAAVGGRPMVRTVQIRQGADGTVLPFTKRFTDPEVAVQTQFTIAEAYFELAKKHRELKQEELSRLEIAQGKKLLEEAIRDYPETEERAHADYLLANLSLEYAEELQDPEAKKQRYMEAVTRFSDLVSNYSSSPYAPKSQFKKALAFEKLGELEQACEEYVKLSYRYPDNELVAETIARLGQYFMVRGKECQDKTNAETDIVKKEKARRQMLDMFKTAAQVFSRLSVRFPDHQLAGKTIVLSAQCWIRAEELDQAIAVFGSVIEAKKASSDLIAQSMYWSGDCYIKKKDFVNAYRMLKKLTWDYPETTWAKYARGRLSEAALASIEANEEK